jgi:DNA invertase Pin-like site-specific DNA recombinase
MNPAHTHVREPPQGGRSVAIYGRTAIADGTIRTQQDVCHAFASQHGYIVLDAYVCLDDGYPGTCLERPGLQHLRHLMHTHAVEAVIVYDLARLSRSLLDLFLLLDECEDAEVRVHVVLAHAEAPRKECIDEPTA